jgi:hypothetical protein
VQRACDESCFADTALPDDPNRIRPTEKVIKPFDQGLGGHEPVSNNQLIRYLAA